MKCVWCDEPASYVHPESKKPFCRECTFNHGIAAYICERCEREILDMLDSYYVRDRCYCEECFLTLCEKEMKV